MEKQIQLQELALEQAIRILKKKRITSRDYRNLDKLTGIIFDVNVFNIQVLTDRLYRSQSCEQVYQAQSFQPKSKESSEHNQFA